MFPVQQLHLQFSIHIPLRAAQVQSMDETSYSKGTSAARPPYLGDDDESPDPQSISAGILELQRQLEVFSRYFRNEVADMRNQIQRVEACTDLLVLYARTDKHPKSSNAVYACGAPGAAKTVRDGTRVTTEEAFGVVGMHSKSDRDEILHYDVAEDNNEVLKDDCLESTELQML
jgi:hypothetical protein